MAYQTQFERLELKYLIDESLASEIRSAIEPYCVADEYNGRFGRGYFISSLYFDSPDLAFYRAKARSDHDRLKLRARIYEPGGDVSLEIKRKRGDVVWKQRGLVRQEQFEDACQGFYEPAAVKSKYHRSVDLFASLRCQYGAEPKLTVEYEREAYASRTGEYARITFDRQVTAYPTEEYHLSEGAELAQHVQIGRELASTSAIVLELKCESLMPAWMADLILGFELHRVGFSKYGRGMQDHVGNYMVRSSVLREAKGG